MARKRERFFIILIAAIMLLSIVGSVFMLAFGNTKTPEQRAQEELLKQLEEQEGQAEPLPAPEVYVPPGDVTQLEATDIKVGEGQEVKEGDTITAHYHGTLAKDGTVFDSSFERGEPATFSLAQVIEGWQKGIPGMKVGGQRRLVIPSELAYGAQESGDIPANSDLVFVVELISVGE